MRQRIQSMSLALLVLTCASLHGQELFIDSGQRLGEGASWDVALGDLDRDGDLDAVVANTDIGATIWLNDGSGIFTDAGSRLSLCNWVLVEDFDDDGWLDVVAASWDEPITVWWNGGSGAFGEERTSFGAPCLNLDAGDLDGDEDLDLYVGNAGQDLVYINDGNGTFVDSGQRFGSQPTGGVAMGDMDGDGDLDVVAAGWDEPGRVWGNDGTGTFSQLSSLNVSAIHVHDAALADLDDDGDLDVFFSLAGGICCRNVWINDGTGVLSAVDPGVLYVQSHGIAVGDLDQDGFIDVAFAVGAAFSSPSKIWLGSSEGFADSGLDIGRAGSGGVAFGDLDGDGDLDLFVAFYAPRMYPWPNEPQPNQVWLNTTND